MRQVSSSLERAICEAANAVPSTVGRIGAPPIAERVVRRMPTRKSGSFDVILARGLLRDDADTTTLRELVRERDVLLVTTPTVARRYAHPLVDLVAAEARRLDVLVERWSERTKTLASVEEICSKALAIGVDRKALFLSLGGGVCSDIVTVAAALVRRGIRHIRIPTTLIGQVDAGIGIKGGINHLLKKSFLGVFHPPAAVFVDAEALASLPRRAIGDGIAEIAKIALVCDRELFVELEVLTQELVASRFQCAGSEWVIERSIEAMMRQLEPNLFENRTFRRGVDLGHTFSPLLEAACDFELTHGRAVSVDLALSASIAVDLEMLERVEFERIADVLAAAKLPVFAEELAPEVCRAALEEASRHRGGRLNLVVPCGLGAVAFVEKVDLVSKVLPSAITRVRRRSKTCAVFARKR